MLLLVTPILTESLSIDYAIAPMTPDLFPSPIRCNYRKSDLETKRSKRKQHENVLLNYVLVYSWRVYIT